ncbi:TPA: hypothetical protein ENS27_03805 [bacterium]|nr:hypothetical protein [bacterium]
MITAYVYDDDLRIKANKKGKNYWYEYIKEMNEQLGLNAKAIPSKSLENKTLFDEIMILFIGDLPESRLTDNIKNNLSEWVKNGGVLIGFNTIGLDEIFGNACDSTISQPESDWTISGYFSLNTDPLTTDIHSYLHPEQKLIIFSDIRCLIPKDSKEIAHLYNTDYSVITSRDYGKGHAYYFAFNVPQTIWVLHQGIPITHDRDGDGYYRTGDLIPTADNEREVLYADEIIFLIQNMIAHKPQPLIYQMPPKDDQVPDAMFFWGGDDESATGTQLWASNWMKEKGLPYHINIMRNAQGNFTVTKEEYEAIKANGHEPSLHYNFIDNFDPLAFTEEQLKEQMDAYYKMYGEYPICTVNHWCRWTGWADTARWMMNAGGKADNSFIHHRLPPLNPCNRLGFVFGTSFPFFFYDDYEHENAKLDFLEEPITAYEIGYSATDVTDFDIIYKSIDMAINYHLVMDMFYHPINVYNHQACRDAIEEDLRYIDSKGIVAVHKGNDGIWEWWHKRSKSSVYDIEIKGETISFSVNCEYDEGMIVRVPIESDEADFSPICDGKKASYKIRRDFGKDWLFVIVPKGKHRVELKMT